MSAVQKRPRESFLQHLIIAKKLRAAEAAGLGRQATEMYPEEIVLLTIEKGLISESEAYHSLADFYGHPYIDLHTTTVDEYALAKLTASTARQLNVLPYLLNENELSIAIARYDLDTIDTVRAETGCEPYVHITSHTQLTDAIDLYYPAMTLSEAGQAASTGSYMSAGGDSPMVKEIASALVANAARARASDIHIEPQESSIRVRMRVDGVLREEIRFPRQLGAPLCARFKILSDLDIAESRHPQDGRISFKVEARTIDLRISFAPTIYGEKIVIRLLDRSGAAADLRAMELSLSVSDRLNRVVSAPNGVVLVTGPTGSGKSTTCYAILEHLKDVARNIVTIEDPVEYRLDGLTQIQVQQSIGLNFAMILRSVLRQDPDVILVGEIRDLETASIATQAALTGHLVISTLHTNNAIQAVLRLVEMGVDPFMVAPSLNGVLGQRLARRICLRCKEPVAPTTQDLTMFRRYGAEPKQLFTGKGCAACSETGFRGRVGIHEIVVVDDDIRQLIMAGAPLHDMEAVARESGYRGMRYDGLKKALTGLISTSEVRRVTVAKEDFIATT